MYRIFHEQILRMSKWYTIRLANQTIFEDTSAVDAFEFLYKHLETLETLYIVKISCPTVYGSHIPLNNC